MEYLTYLKAQFPDCDDVIRKLNGSPQFSEACNDLIGKKQSLSPRPYDVNDIYRVVLTGLKGPNFTERQTLGERRKRSIAIKKSIAVLRKELLPLLETRGDFPHQFQSNFDLLSLEASLSFSGESKSDSTVNDASDNQEDDFDEKQHWGRYAIYHLLMDRLSDLFDIIELSAECWADTETILKKPNDPNASRLYFIRTLTKSFCFDLLSPHRSATLALTSIFFECDDLDEAAISKIAPDPRKKLRLLLNDDAGSEESNP